MSTKRVVQMVGVGLGLAILLILLPTTKGYRVASKEAMAVGIVRTIIVAEVTHSDTHRRYGTIQELIDEGLLDLNFSGPVPGYTFSVILDDGSYVVTANRVTRAAGAFDFYANADGIVRYSTDVSAAPPKEAGMPVR